VQFAQIGKQTRIVINNKVNDFIPHASRDAGTRHRGASGHP
jgi:hypothetical protein